MSLPLMETNPFPGNWQATYIPAHLFAPVASGSPDPAAPLAWSNYWNGFFQGRGYTFYHPTGVRPDPANIHYDILLPPFIKHWRNGSRVDIGVGLHWWVSGDLGATQIAGQVQLMAHSDGTVLGTPSTAQCAVNIGPVACAGQMKTSFVLGSAVNWAGGTVIREADALHICIARRANNNMINDTYLYEWFVFGLTLLWRLH